MNQQGQQGQKWLEDLWNGTQTEPVEEPERVVTADDMGAGRGRGEPTAPAPENPGDWLAEFMG